MTRNAPPISAVSAVLPLALLGAPTALVGVFVLRSEIVTLAGVLLVMAFLGLCKTMESDETITD